MSTTNVVTLSAVEAKLANTLFEAWQTQKPLDLNEYKDVLKDDDSAYRVQRRLTELKQEPVGGYKVSLTSTQTQKMFDATEPLYGAQVQSHFLTSPAKVPLTKVMEPLAEVELVFKAKVDLSPEDSLTDLWHKTTVAPGVEVPDARFKDWFPALPKLLVMADAAVGGYVVYGQEVDATNFTVDQLAQVTTELFHDGKKLKDGQASEVLGNPLNSLKWLVEKLHSQGLRLTAGQRVSTGTFLLPEKLTAGKWEAKFSHNLGNVNLDVE
ncbi:Hydratase decarboxylase [Agrilactobacillus composti DSM 18527 = JCM 14202]|uniref:Hydratase decarboxylase n=1 Tax=Agrilactobacillus composti DSM 18527 = JCM 14202 TaxID=1423734 RepID=X0PF67_9LACO|nr:2-keto-4-pentenoate hydratase [Agrilactobacillus composti]KRM35071.1 Hydratase decarboxylase [Agrilactobacillus composti DSM 18527 = JCM 14202]GAF40484.1 hydratase/decarboxylase [Agrilactobacillus composti DSM 18527 = JCM 14202]